MCFSYKQILTEISLYFVRHNMFDSNWYWAINKGLINEIDLVFIQVLHARITHTGLFIAVGVGVV